MFKKGVPIILRIILSILALSVFSAVADLNTLVLTPGDIDWTGSHSLYEFASQVVRIDFLKSNQSQLLQVNVTLAGATVNSIVQGATCTIAGNVITCGDIDILRLNITASNVGATSNFDWVVDAIDSQSGLVTKTLQLEVVNDNVAPRYTLNSPADYVLLKNETTLFNITPLELESGFNTARLYYDYYPAIGSSTVLGEFSMSCGTYCTTPVTLNPSPDNHYFGYFFNLTDKAGNLNLTATHWIYIDEVAPVVTPILPADNIHLNSQSYNYGFTVQENSFDIDALFSPQVQCFLYIDSILKNMTTLTANATVTSASSLSGLLDGPHTWYASCTDTAGWSTATSTRTFVLDTAGPVIVLTDPAQNSIINTSRVISVSVSDVFSDVSNVWYTDQNGVNQTITFPYSISTTGWPEGIFTLLVYANDSLNNPSNASFSFIVDSTGPLIELLSPANNSVSSGTLRFNATDANGGDLTCVSIIDGVEDAVFSPSASGTIYEFEVTLADGSHTWAAACTDQVGNRINSETRTIIIDTLVPAVALSSPDDGTNLAGAFDFTFIVTELNPGVGVCNLQINGTVVANAAGYANFTGITLNPSNDIQEWKVNCTDAAGNQGSSAARSVYYDTLAPIISVVSPSEITDSVAHITWLVSETSTNSVFYGIDAAQLSTRADVAVANMTPSAGLAGLSSSTQYFYLVQSCDQWSRCANSTTYNFITSAPPASPPSSGGGGGGGGGFSKTECNDGKDNDKDGFIDGNDPGCESTEDDEESNSARIKESSGSCREDWRCTEWNECSDGVQTRTCQDWALCGTEFAKPDEQGECTPGSVNLGREENTLETGEEAGSNALTGAVTGVINRVKNNGVLIAGLMSLAAVAGLAVWKREFFGSKIISKGLQKPKGEQIQEQLKKGGIIK